MRKSQHVIAVTLVATALCADRVAFATPPVQAPVMQWAQRLASRLSGSFRRVVPAAKLFQQRREAMRIVPAPRIAAARRTIPVPLVISPFYFRLPPPLA
jgi:predicted trehalose synthase